MLPTHDRPRRLPQAAVVLLLATLTLATLSAPAANAQNLPASVYTLEGYVYDHNAQVLPGATVTIYLSPGGTPQTATTDSSGKYTFSNLAAGRYNATAQSPGLVSAFVPIQVTGTDSRIQQSFLLRSPDQQVYGIPLTLRGVVKDSQSGAPVPGAAIEIWNYYSPRDGYASGGPVNSEQRQTAKSGNDGSYSVTLSEGSVGIAVRKDGFDVLHAHFEIREDRVLDLPMRKTSAQSIVISGVVKSADGRALADAWVNVQPDHRCGDDPRMGCAQPVDYVSEPSPQSGDVYFYHEPAVSPYNGTSTDKDGKYSLRTTPGRILVIAHANEHMQKQQAIEAQAGEQKTVDFVLDKIPADSVRIFGKVVDRETGKAVSFAQVNLENQRWGHHNYTQTKEDGSFEFWTKPGYTLVTASAYEWYYRPCEAPAEKSSGASTIRAPEPYPCESGQRDREYMPRVITVVGTEGEARELKFDLVPRPLPDATFQGYVVNKSSEKAIAGATVSFYNELTRDYGQAITDADGSYKIRVHGGYYTVRVYAQGYFDVVENPEVKSGETKRLDLFASPGERMYGYCCYTYASHDAGGYGATKGTVQPVAAGCAAPPSAPQQSSMEGSSSARAGADASSGREAYLGEGGGLGPYSANRQEPGGSAPGPALILVALAVLGAVIAVRRRA
jgi:hypothetical protein